MVLLNPSHSARRRSLHNDKVLDLNAEASFGQQGPSSSYTPRMA